MLPRGVWDPLDEYRARGGYNWELDDVPLMSGGVTFAMDPSWPAPSRPRRRREWEEEDGDKETWTRIGYALAKWEKVVFPYVNFGGWAYHSFVASESFLEDIRDAFGLVGANAGRFNPDFVPWVGGHALGYREAMRKVSNYLDEFRAMTLWAIGWVERNESLPSGGLTPEAFLLRNKIWSRWNDLQALLHSGAFSRPRELEFPGIVQRSLADLRS